MKRISYAVVMAVLACVASSCAYKGKLKTPTQITLDEEKRRKEEAKEAAYQAKQAAKAQEKAAQEAQPSAPKE